MLRGTREWAPCPGEPHRRRIVLQEICWLQAIYGDPIVGVSNPEQKHLLIPLDDFVRARVWRSKGRFVGIDAKKNILCCVKIACDVAVFWRPVSLFAWSKLPNNASKSFYVVTGGSVGEEFTGDHEEVAVNHFCW